MNEDEESMEPNIDFVVTWVDGNDPVWREKKQSYLPQHDNGMNTSSRYRDWGILKYWFRAVEQHAPWVNKIFFVTEGHVPDWLNVNCDKLVIVKHEDYISHKFLPTFNSNVIELNLYKIKGLSEWFVNFNDDMFLNKDVKKDDFFKNGLPCDTGIFSPIVPKPNSIAPIVLNNIQIINKYFNSRQVLKVSWKNFFKPVYGKHLLKNIVILPWKDILGFYDQHIPVSYKKAIFKEVATKESELFLEVFSHRFRQKDEINHWLVRYWQLCTNQFHPRGTKFGEYYSLSDNNEEIIRDIRSGHHSIICINDGDSISNFEKAKQELIHTFEEKYPNKSMFEK